MLPLPSLAHLFGQPIETAYGVLRSLATIGTRNDGSNTYSATNG
jgi:hypothetical protein